MSLNKNSVYCVMPRSSKPPDTCKWGGPKWRGILKFSPQKKRNTIKSQWDLKIKPTKLPKARENADDQVVMVLVLQLISWDGGASFLDQSQSEVQVGEWNFELELEVKEKQSNHWLLSANNWKLLSSFYSLLFTFFSHLLSAIRY